MGRSIFARVVSILDWVGFTLGGYSSILIWGSSLLIRAGPFGGGAAIGPPYFRLTQLCLRLGRSIFAWVVSILDSVGFTSDGYCLILVWGNSLWIGAGLFEGGAAIGAPLFPINAALPSLWDVQVSLVIAQVH